MKKLLLSLALIMMSASMFGQTSYSYEYGNQTISLTDDGTSKYFVQNTSGQVVGIYSFQISQYSYYSKRFNCTNGSKAIILPRIVFKMNTGHYAYEVPNELPDPTIFTSLGTIDTTDKVHYISCSFSNSTQVLQAVEALYDSGLLEWCEPEMLLDVKLSNDNPLFSYQYFLYNTKPNATGIDINVVPAWNMVSDCSDITVAVIDDGVEHNHEDMGNVLDGYTAWNGSGNIGIGEPVNESSINTKGHGTCVAGLIGADDNTLQTIGVAPGVGILPVNIFPYEDASQSYLAQYPGVSNISIMQAILATYEDADVINCSWNIKDPSNAIAYALKKAYTEGRDGLGCVIFGSSGNWYNYGNGITGVSFPANMPEVIAVGGINKYGSGWYFSQRGSLLELVAPTGVGVNDDGEAIGDVTTLDRMGTYGYHTYNFTGNFGGTSASCALASGVAALVLAKVPGLTTSEVRGILHDTASDLGTSGFDTTFGYGIVNAFEAVKEAYYMGLQKFGGEVMAARHGELSFQSDGENSFMISQPVGTLINQTKGIGQADGDKWTICVSSVATGQRVLSESVLDIDGFRVDGSSWKPGVYAVTATSKENSLSGKILVK